MNAIDLTAPSMPIVFARDGHAFANSRDVASYFRKAHKDVMRTIRTVLTARPDLNRRNFALVEQPDDKGEMRPTYDMDRDGFTLIAMGFTGAEALEFKLRYIERFNEMESALRNPSRPTVIPPAEPPEQVRDLNSNLRTVTETRQTWGVKSAQQMWLKLGMPTVPAMFEPQQQPTLFDMSGQGDAS